MTEETVPASEAKPPTGGQTAASPAANEVLPFGAQKPRTMKVGRVVSDKMDKTVVVAVDYVRRHPLYHKRITRTSKFMAHDEQNACRPGDVVRIEETRPLSKRKRWVVREIVERAVQL